VISRTFKLDTNRNSNKRIQEVWSPYFGIELKFIILTSEIRFLKYWIWNSIVIIIPQWKKIWKTPCYTRKKNWNTNPFFQFNHSTIHWRFKTPIAKSMFCFSFARLGKKLWELCTRVGKFLRIFFKIYSKDRSPISITDSPQFPNTIHTQNHSLPRIPIIRLYYSLDTGESLTIRGDKLILS